MKLNFYFKLNNRDGRASSSQQSFKSKQLSVQPSPMTSTLLLDNSSYGEEDKNPPQIYDDFINYFGIQLNMDGKD